MALFRFILVSFLVVCSAQTVFAQEDFIAPAKFSFNVQPGQTLQHQVIYKSGIGGIYDVSARQFHYDAAGNKIFLDELLLPVSFSDTVVEFQLEEERVVPFEIVVPAHLSPQDVYLGVFVRRRSEELRTFELGSLVFLRIGGFADFQGKVSPLQFQRNLPRNADAQPSFDAISFTVENTAGRYFSLTPRLELYDLAGNLTRTLENPSSLVFPEFSKTLSFSNSSEDVETGLLSKGVLKIFSEDGAVFHEEQLRFPQGEAFLAQQSLTSPFRVESLQASLSSPDQGWKSLLKRPLFQVFAVVIVLTFVGFSFVMRRK